MTPAPWFDEIDLDPENAWLRMGTRNLGTRPWLVADERREPELALKRHLLRTRHGEVFAAAADSLPAGHETLELVEAEVGGSTRGPATVTEQDHAGLHPLDQAGRMVQEDLCLLRPDAGRWILAAASLCFPSRWRLIDKFERPMAAVHGPVPGYDKVLASRVDSLLNRLEASIVWRRNWFLHPDPSLFQPLRPADGDPTIPAGRCLDELYLRSERQTLRRLPASGWVLFTIRIQQTSLRNFVGDDDRRRRLSRFLAEADPALTGHKGLSPSQVAEARSSLAGFHHPDPTPRRNLGHNGVD